MSCCGKARSQAAGRTDAPRSAEIRSGQGRPGQSVRAQPPRAAVLFEYLGETALTATGPVTGKRYRFERPGARAAIDARDAPALRQVSRLRPV
jgi:hypothetical protein